MIPSNRDIITGRRRLPEFDGSWHGIEEGSVHTLKSALVQRAEVWMHGAGTARLRSEAGGGVLQKHRCQDMELNQSPQRDGLSSSDALPGKESG